MDGLPAEEVPPDLLTGRQERPYEQSFDKSDLSPEDVPEEALYQATRQREVNSGQVVLPIRYILLGGSAIALLLVIVAVLLTILVMKSC